VFLYFEFNLFLLINLKIEFIMFGVKQGEMLNIFLSERFVGSDSGEVFS